MKLQIKMREIHGVQIGKKNCSAGRKTEVDKIQ